MLWLWLLYTNQFTSAYCNIGILQVADKFIKFMSGKKPETCKLIVSSHNYENTPSAEELGKLLAQIQATGADIVKIATTATEIVDVSRMFQILVHCQVSLPPNPCAIPVSYLPTSISSCCFFFSCLCIHSIRPTSISSCCFCVHT
jgi:hypothetical protein